MESDSIEHRDTKRQRDFFGGGENRGVASRREGYSTQRHRDTEGLGESELGREEVQRVASRREEIQRQLTTKGDTEESPTRSSPERASRA